MAMMEGVLLKWTNYLSGWQPRWFVLEVGVLAYYKSQEEVGLGSRGSIKMACCEITVHPSDQVRIDLKIPPEQHIYLRAATPAERQQWIVALGTAKACITNVEKKTSGDVHRNSVNDLKEKMGELNMYRSLLLQQINTIKLLCTSKEESQEFSEAATMLSATCDEFLKNLCDCMELAENDFNASPTSPTASTVDKPSRLHSFRKELLHESHSQGISSPPLSVASSASSSNTGFSVNAPVGRGSRENTHGVSQQDVTAAPAYTQHSSPDSSFSSLQSTKSSNSSLNSATVGSREERQPQAPQPNHGYNSLQKVDVTNRDPPTFFSLAPHKFEEIQLTSDGHVPTKPFLNSCSSIIPFFDTLGSTAFAPVKLDIAGNIKKLLTKHNTDVKAFATLQNIVYQELKSNSHEERGSATDALLWLKRALEFMQIFLSEVVKGEKDLAVAAGTAYGKTLRRYHGWVVRGVFSLAVKAVPYRGDFLTALGTTDYAVAPPKYVLRDMKTCTTALGLITNNINLFYKKHGLDSDATV